MVFDEVDSGIGGAVAEIVGRELHSLAANAQVLCVTHLAQVAAQGHNHLRVAKLLDGKTTRTTLTHLSVDDRVERLLLACLGVSRSSPRRGIRARDAEDCGGFYSAASSCRCQGAC